MSVPVIAFFNNKGGVGKTSLVYHVSSMLAEQDYRVVAADMDPQNNLELIPVETDTNCIAMVKHYRSLMPMSLESGKPIFQLKPGDGAIGAHVSTVRDAYQDFKKISLDILERAHINMLDII